MNSQNSVASHNQVLFLMKLNLMGISHGYFCWVVMSPADMYGSKLIPSMPSSTLGFQSCSGEGKEHRELLVGGFCGPEQEVVRVTFAHYAQNSVT